MIAQKIKSLFDPYIELELQVWKNFEQLGELKEYKKETTLKQANTIERNLSLLLKGVGGNLLWNGNNFICIDLFFDNSFISDYASFKLQQPSPIEVKIFENSTVFHIPYQSFQKTLLEGNHGEKITRIVAEAALFKKQQQQIDLLTKTAKERYLYLIQTCADIERLPLKYLASYLGITPQSLSRIRNEKL